MSISNSRITANAVVNHVHFASVSTMFTVSFDKNAGQNVVSCINDNNKTTAEFFVGPQQDTVDYITSDLAKLGYTQF